MGRLRTLWPGSRQQDGDGGSGPSIHAMGPQVNGRCPGLGWRFLAAIEPFNRLELVSFIIRVIDASHQAVQDCPSPSSVMDTKFTSWNMEPQGSGAHVSIVTLRRYFNFLS